MIASFGLFDHLLPQRYLDSPYNNPHHSHPLPQEETLRFLLDVQKPYLKKNPSGSLFAISS